ncbi:MAG: hypothetical protein R3Y13_05660 [bacterium]
MNDSKILIELHIPALNSIYNVNFPINLKVGQIVDLLNKGLYDLSDEIYVEKNNFLYDENGDKLPFNTFIHSSNLKNGSKLVLL